MSNFYKVFFTIYFDYASEKNKIVTRFFKSDIDLGPQNFSKDINDKNIYKYWNKFAKEKPLNDLNPSENFEEKKTTNKKIITHRIINLKKLTEVFI